MIISKRKNIVGKKHMIIEGIPVQFIPANGLEVEAIKTAKEIKYRGVKTKVLRAEYLIALFLKSGRRKDKEKVNMLLEQTKIDKKKLKKILSQKELFKEKERFHKEMARLPFEEKIKILFRLQKIAKAIKK